MSRIMNIEDIKALCNDETIQITAHTLKRCKERNIKYSDIKNCIMCGEIIEDYPNDYPFPSSLLLGCTLNNKYLHVVVGIGNGKLWIITAYYPDTNKWDKDYKQRRNI